MANVWKVWIMAASLMRRSPRGQTYSGGPNLSVLHAAFKKYPAKHDRWASAHFIIPDAGFNLKADFMDIWPIQQKKSVRITILEILLIIKIAHCGQVEIFQKNCREKRKTSLITCSCLRFASSQLISLLQETKFCGVIWLITSNISQRYSEKS